MGEGGSGWEWVGSGWGVGGGWEWEREIVADFSAGGERNLARVDSDAIFAAVGKERSEMLTPKKFKKNSPRRKFMRYNSPQQHPPLCGNAWAGYFSAPNNASDALRVLGVRAA